MPRKKIKSIGLIILLFLEQRRRFTFFQCYFQLSPGGIPPPQNPKFPPEKHPKYKKHKKMHRIYPPDMCFPPRTWSLELTLLFSHVGQQPKVPIRVGSRRHRCDAICNRGSGGIKHPQLGQGRSPSRKRFWKVFDRIELVFINCLPCEKDCTRFWTSLWCCDFIFYFNISIIFYSYIFSFIGLKYITPPLRSYVSRILESRGTLTGFSLYFHMAKRDIPSDLLENLVSFPMSMLAARIGYSCWVSQT